MSTLSEMAANVSVEPGPVVREFNSGTEALKYCKSLGAGYTITVATREHYMFAVRRLVTTISQEQPLRTV